MNTSLSGVKEVFAKRVRYPTQVNTRPIFRVEESTSPNGERMVTVIMD